MYDVFKRICDAEILTHTYTHTRSQASFPYNCYTNTLHRLCLYRTVCSVL